MFFLFFFTFIIIFLIFFSPLFFFFSLTNKKGSWKFRYRIWCVFFTFHCGCQLVAWLLLCSSWFTLFLRLANISFSLSLSRHEKPANNANIAYVWQYQNCCNASDLPSFHFILLRLLFSFFCSQWTYSTCVICIRITLGSTGFIWFFCAFFGVQILYIFNQPNENIHQIECSMKWCDNQIISNIVYSRIFRVP